MKPTGATKEFTNASNRPWTLYTKFSTLREPYQIQDADGVTVAVVLHDPMSMEDDQAEDNARLLLTAVNERERLRAALRTARTVIFATNKFGTWNKELTQIDAALNEVEG